MNRRTLATSTLLGLAVAFATALPQIGFAQTNPVVGMWKLNLANSTFKPGPPPRSQTAIVQTEGQGLKITLEGIDAQGNPAKAVIVNFNDGEVAPSNGFSRLRRTVRQGDHRFHNVAHPNGSDTG